jgi:hypothetical protein
MSRCGGGHAIHFVNRAAAGGASQDQKTFARAAGREGWYSCQHFRPLRAWRSQPEPALDFDTAMDDIEKDL